MAIPQVFHTVKPQDFTVTPVTVHKKYVIQRTNLYSGSLPFTSSGYTIWDAVYTNEKLKLGTGKTYPTNSWDGSNKHIIWKSIDAQYYRFPYDSFATFEHANERFSYKFLNTSASIIVAPQQDFGEGIQTGTVEITSSLGYYLNDDGNGNLYDVSINTGSFPSKTGLMCYVDVKDIYRKHTINDDPIATLVYYSGQYPYRSFTSTPSVFNYNNVGFGKLDIYAPTGSQILGKSTWMDFNIADSSYKSYTSIDHADEFNFTDDFSIAFWLFAADSQDTTGSVASILSKNGLILKDTFGDVILQKDTVSIPATMMSRSYFDELTNVYPYDLGIRLDAPAVGKLQFRKSDGINTFTITSSASILDLRRHIAITKSGSLVTMYVDGNVITSGSDNTSRCYNRHAIMFGARNRQQQDFCRMLLNDARFYNRSLSGPEVATLSASASMSMKQTAVVGNVFYKKGLIVASSHDPKYNNLFNYDFTLKYRNTHTIYQWETIVRIPKGSFNLSQNPSALQNPYTDLLRNEFTGSNPNVDLYPYATTIGLYNDKKDLLAVAKLNQPLKMRDDVDMNISIKWDS